MGISVGGLSLLQIGLMAGLLLIVIAGALFGLSKMDVKRRAKILYREVKAEREYQI